MTVLIHRFRLATANERRTVLGRPFSCLPGRELAALDLPAALPNLCLHLGVRPGPFGFRILLRLGGLDADEAVFDFVVSYKWRRTWASR